MLLKSLQVLRLSPQLSNLIGTQTSSRPQAVKKVWEYIKSHNLQSCPTGDKRYIISDPKMLSTFGESRIHMLQLGRLMKPHFKEPVE
ncbi:hypothetical protein TrLO_g2106 [Triparma laevis f. longispina]|uniref:DM2 domain-containing protein n=1 Tax=Triparma laevis f. longispina TaxID=1714387 RepID=A0A9W7KW91_9STRA|nr:hypothetical protein TrLO_g2106 [Triparma laevis f. longispina]